ncbi:MAG: RDD family protein [Candidatus Levybacteria bacterium]|nr:RDD family protein [Candidatus Levybacteria bacterium]
MKYSGFFRRLFAFILDGIITNIPFILIFGFKESYTSTELGIFVVAWTAYTVWMVGMYGATIGKKLMGIKILKENGEKVNYSDALVREIASYLSIAIVGLGYLFIIWDKKKQGWHDKIAKTVVVNV